MRVINACQLLNHSSLSTTALTIIPVRRLISSSFIPVCQLLFHSIIPVSQLLSHTLQFPVLIPDASIYVGVSTRCRVMADTDVDDLGQHYLQCLVVTQ